MNGGTTPNNTPLNSIPVLTNATDADGNGTINKATVAVVGTQVGGTFTANTAAGANQGTISFTPTPGFTGTASVNYTVNDEKGLISNVATLSVTVTAPPSDLATTLAGPANGVNASPSGNYTVTYTNNGPNAAPSATRTVTLSAAVTNLLINGAASIGTAGTTQSYAGGVTYDTGTGIINFGTLTSQATSTTASFTFSFTNPAAGNISATSTTSVPSGANDPNLTNNSATQSTTLLPAPVAVSSTNAAILNTAGATALSPNLSATVSGSPGNSVNYYSLTSLPSSGTLTFNTIVLTSANFASQQITPALLNTLKYAPVAGFGGSVTFNYKVTDANGGTSTTHSATSGGTATAGDATYTIPVSPVADVATSITPTPSGSVNAGGALSFAVTFANNGPSTADGFSRTLTLTAGLGASNVTIIGAGGLTGTYDNTNNPVVFNINPATLASGANLNVTVSIAAVPVALTSVVANTTITTSINQGSDAGANSASSTVTVTSIADVTTTLSGPQVLVVGQPSGPYTAVFTNNGPGQATQVTQIITLPVGATMTAAQVTASGGTYTAGTGTTGGTLSLGTAPVTLANGASNTFNFTITAPTANGTNYSMTSTVGTNTNQGSNTAADAATLAITLANRFVTHSDNNSLAANTKVTASVILNDDNPDATTDFTATVVTQPTHGAVTLNADGGYNYTPNPNYIGTDSFTYQICQTGTTPTCSNISLVSLNIYDPNLVCLSGTGKNLLLNPSFTAGNDGSFTSGYTYVAQAANALVPEGYYGVGSDASKYHPNFTGTGRTGAGDNFMIVNGAANIQRVYAQTVPVQPNRYYTFSVYANSVNPASPAQLGFVINGESTSVVTTLDGTTNFVKLSDVWFSGNSTTASFEVRDVNRVANGNDFGLDDVYFGTCTKNLLVNNITAPALSKSAAATTIPALTGTASGGPTLASFTIQTLPPAASGTLALNGVAITAGQIIALADASKLTFTPTSTFTGTQAVFTYTATDSNGAGSDNIGTYTIPLDTTLVAVDDVTTTPLNTSVTVAVTANDRVGANKSPINVATVDLQPGVSGLQQTVTVNGGTASVNSSGQVTFTPNPGFLGTAFIPYTVTDGQGIVSNQATLMVQVVSQLDLATTITSPATGGIVTAGQQVTITGTTANNSPTGTNADVVQQLQLPANLIGTLTFTRNGTTVAATYAVTTGLVVFPTLTNFAAGASATFGVTFLAPGTGPLTATASVNNSSPDVNLVNNVAAITLAVTPQFDLATTLTGPAAVVTGNLATYTITTANNGPSPVTGAQQTVQLPTGLAGVFATNGGTYSSSTGVVIFPTLNLANGQVQTNSVSFAATAAFSPAATVTPNTTGAGDPVTANNTAYLNGATTATAVVVNSAAATTQSNVYVTVTGPSQAAPGATVAYTVTQGNNGPNAATGVQTQVSLPTGLGVTGFLVNNVAGTLSNGVITFGTNGPTYTVTTGLLSLVAVPGSQASAATPQSYAISFPAPAAGPSIAVTASVSATTLDLVPGNNVATAETEIQPLADLSTSISRIEGGTTATGTALTAGQQVTYSVQTVNNSANPALNVLQTAAVPAGLPVASLQLNGLIGTLSNGVITFGNGATYNVASGLLSLPILPILAGKAVQTNTLSFAVPAITPLPDGSTPLQAVATVSSPTADGTTANNTASIINSVTAQQDLSVALSGPAQAVQGNPVFYTVTATNNGTSAIGSQTTQVQLPTSLNVTGFLVNNVAGTLSNGVITFGTNGPAYTVATGLLAMPAATVGAPGTSTITTVQFLAPISVVQLDIAATTVAPNESNLTNNSAVLSTRAAQSALTSTDLSTTITSSLSGTQAAGITATYTVTTTNATTGAAAQNAVQTVALPAGLATATLNVNNTSGTYSRATGLVTYNTTMGGVISYNPATGALVFPAVASLALNTSSQNTVTFPLPVSGPVVVTATSAADNPDGNATNNTVNISTPVTSSATVAFGMSGPATTTAGSTVSYTLAATNNGPTAATDLGMTVTLPAGVTNYTLNGVAKTGSGTVTVYGGTGTTLPAGQSATSVIAFTAPTSASFLVNGAASNSNSPTGAATSTSSVSTTQANALPVANDVANTKQAPQGNTGSSMLLSALGGTGAKYTVTNLPTGAQGVLKLGSNAVTVNQVIALTDVANLTFTPATNFVGNAFFTYTATDNSATPLTSGPATYTIPVAQDINSAYTVITKGGNTGRYTKGDVIAYVVDPNTALYNGTGVVYSAVGLLQSGAANGLPTTGTNAVLTAGTLPAGTAFNSTTGLITVTDPTLLPLAGGSYPLTVTTTDINGGTNSRTFTLVTGASPLPVELAEFTATPISNRDSRLDWATASEHNNDHFDVERSFDGIAFDRIAAVAGQGNKTSRTVYSLTDAGVAAKATGPVYYRLKQVDADGTVAYSPVQVVRFTKLAAPVIALYPNPAVGSTQLDLSKLPAGTYQVSLVDMTGRTVLGLDLTAGITHTVDLAPVASGTYVVRVSGKATDGTVVNLAKRLVKE